jgi:sugar lactone lactonase YvrE
MDNHEGLVWLGLGLAIGGLGCGGGSEVVVEFPVTPIELVANEFMSAEGIAFNGEGRLFVVADTDLWEIGTDGSTTMVADLTNPVGLGSMGAQDILVGEFGPLSFTSDGANDDGSVVRVTPDGAASTVATGIGDPNFIHVRDDGTLLVSDDFTDIIYEVIDGTASTFLQGIQSPNGLVESLDRTELYVAQTFTSVAPLAFDDRVWKVPLTDGRPGTPELLTELGGLGANDGVTLDAQGRLYVAENLDGKVWRIDPATGETELVAEDMRGVASLAFGEGNFHHTSIYATQLLGGKVWEIPVGVQGAPVNR